MTLDVGMLEIDAIFSWLSELRSQTFGLCSGNEGDNFLFPWLRLRSANGLRELRSQTFSLCSGTRLRQRGGKLLSLKDYKSARLSYRCYALLVFLFCIGMVFLCMM